MKIAIIVEGKTEKAFKNALIKYLQSQLAGKMPSFQWHIKDGRIPKEEKLRREVIRLLNDRPQHADHVIALTDVYTGKAPPDFVTAQDAKEKMRRWVGDEPRFHPHAAQHDFESWLLPYWTTIQKLAGHNKNAPGGNPENINHTNPPAHRIKEIFRLGSCRDDYVKPRDAARILRENDLSVAIGQCGELRAFVNTIVTICGGTAIP